MIYINELRNKFKNHLISACERQYQLLINDIGSDKIYSYAIYCSSGCRNFGVAVATDEDFKKTTGDILFDSSQWSNLNNYYSEFSVVDSYIDELYEIFYEEEIEGVDLDEMNDEQLWEFISKFFVDSIIEVLSILKDRGFFKSQLFCDELLLGLQFGDPDQYALSMMSDVYRAVNSASWNEKIDKHFPR